MRKETNRTTTAATNQPQRPCESLLAAAPRSICETTSASKTMLTSARVQNEPPIRRSRSISLHRTRECAEHIAPPRDVQPVELVERACRESPGGPDPARRRAVGQPLGEGSVQRRIERESPAAGPHDLQP